MPTTNLGMTLPVVGADLDTWGTENNLCLTTVDAAFTSNRYTNFTNATTFATSSATLVMGGYGSSWALTPSKSQRVRVTVTGYLTNGGSNNSTVLDVRYGTGTAPTQGAAVTGSGGLTTDMIVTTDAATNLTPFTLLYEVTGLTLATAYWFDITARSTAGTSTITPNAIIIEEIY